MNTGNETLERIQKEIKENLEKEEEWKRELERLSSANENNNLPRINGILKKQLSEPTGKTSQNLNKFIQNVKTKGMMQRFLKSKGKLIPPPATIITNGNVQPKPIDFVYQPPRATQETGTLTRNGFIPAEEKIKNEVEEFQKRETELRKERRKSQPELMALLHLEDDKDEGFRENSCSSSTSSVTELKSAKSLADLCNTAEDELDAPGTLNLIQQFESLRKI